MGYSAFREVGANPRFWTTPDSEQGENHLWPFIIPGREAVVFVIVGGGLPLTTGQLAVLDLVSREIKPLGLAGVSPHYVSTGHLVYAAEDGSVRAVPFDAASLEITGNPVPLVESVMVKASGAAAFSISDNGRLVYLLGGGGAGAQRSLVWVDRQGREEPIAAPLRSYVYPRISPDGARVVLDIRDEENDLWVWDLAGETLTRLTVYAGSDQYGHWTPDGQRVVFSSTREGPHNVYWTAADGTGTVDRLTESNTPQYVNAALSPDGQWLSYQSDESGRFEIYVRPFPDVEAGRSQVSISGGRMPLWGPMVASCSTWRGSD